MKNLDKKRDSRQTKCQTPQRPFEMDGIANGQTNLETTITEKRKSTKRMVGKNRNEIT